MTGTQGGFSLKSDSVVSDFQKGSDTLQTTMREDMKSASWQKLLAVTQRPSSQGLIDLGQDIGCFTDAQDFATAYEKHAQDFVADINKFGGAVQVLSEAAGTIAQNYKNAQDSDAVGWKDVDNTVNNAQTLQNSPFT